MYKVAMGYRDRQAFNHVVFISYIALPLEIN